jgi:hypothetical protein
LGAIEFLADRSQLPLLELGHAQATPAFCPVKTVKAQTLPTK